MASSPVLARTLKLGPQGRIVIPIEVRRALGLEEGENLIVWIEDDRLVIRTRTAVERELKAMFADIPVSLSEELIRDRREEARREAEE